MPSTISFDPSFLLSLDFGDIDFSRFEVDASFDVKRVFTQEIDHVLVMPNRSDTWNYPESRWTIVNGRITEMTLRWDEPFITVDGIVLDDSAQFVQDWNRTFENQLRFENGEQIWRTDAPIVLATDVRQVLDDYWCQVTYFNPGIESHRNSPAYFAPGSFDSPQVIERFLDDCLWADLRNQWSRNLMGWLYLWPHVDVYWPEMQTNKDQWLEALDAVMGYVFADGRFEVYDSSTDESITTVDRFMEATRKFREERDIEAIQLFFFISVAALELRP